MFFAEFRSSDPFDHLPRVLDQLRRMGFGVIVVNARWRTDSRSDIRVEYSSAGELSTDTLVGRIGQMKGVSDVRHGALQGERA